MLRCGERGHRCRPAGVRRAVNAERTAEEYETPFQDLTGDPERQTREGQLELPAGLDPAQIPPESLPSALIGQFKEMARELFFESAPAGLHRRNSQGAVRRSR